MSSKRRPFALTPDPASAKQDFAQQIQAILDAIDKNTNPVCVGQLRRQLDIIRAQQQIADDRASAEALVQEDRLRLAEEVKADEDVARELQNAEYASVQDPLASSVPEDEFVVVVGRRRGKPRK